MMAVRHLDPAALEAFVFTADLKSFTQAGRALDMTQAAVSLRLARLERSLGRRLLNRTPRSVQLSPEGEAFLPRARAILTAQQHALSDDDQPRTLRLALSDHAAGPELPSILEKIKRSDPLLTVRVRIGLTCDIMRDFEMHKVDAAVVRGGRRSQDGETLFHDPCGWFASRSLCIEGNAIPLITVDDACGMREVATGLLDQAGIPWNDAFVGGSVASSIYAAEGTLGIAPIPSRLASRRLMDIGPLLGLPSIPSMRMVLHMRKLHDRTKDTLRLFASSLRRLGDSNENPQWPQGLGRDTGMTDRHLSIEE